MTDGPERPTPTPHRASFPVLGVRVAFETNSERALSLVSARYAAWSTLDGMDEIASESAARVRLVVHEPEPDRPAPGPVSFRALGTASLALWSEAVAGLADQESLEAVAHLDEAMLDEEALFVEEVLDALTLHLLGALDRQPVHAVALRQADTAVVLAGRSGAGKSTTAYAGMRRGFELMGDEPVFVQMEPRLRVWTRPGPLRLSPEAAARFEDLNSAPVLLPNGKEKVLVERGDAVPRPAERAVIFWLERDDTGGPSSQDGADGPTLERMDADALAEGLGADPDEGYHLYADTLRNRLRALAARGAWKLRIGGSPDEVVDLIERALADVGTGV